MTQSRRILEYAEKQCGTVLIKYPDSAVLRHGGNRGKWYALIGRIAKSRLGLQGDGEVTSINVKSNPDMVSVLRRGKNFLPAYHMNKQHWVGIVLDYGAETDKILTLLDWSYDLMEK